MSLPAVRKRLVRAIKNGDLYSAKRLIQRLPNNKIDTTLPSTGNKSPLVFAAAHRRSEIVEFLLSLGADIAFVDSRGQTACHVAASQHRAETLALLLERGASVDVKDEQEMTPLDCAIRSCATNCMLMLFKSGAPFSCRKNGQPRFANDMAIAATISPSLIQAMLNRDILIRDLPSRESPLHILTQNHAQNLSVLSMLVTVCGVSVDARNGFGYTPLFDAARYGYVENAIALLAAGADVSDPIDQSNTGSVFVEVMSLYDIEQVVGRRMSLIGAFVACGADLDSPNKHGRSARQILEKNNLAITPDSVESARQQIARLRLALVRDRALAVCVGLQSLRLDALQMCEILQHACGPVASMIPFHQWWKIATTVKHFK